ncbi:MAG TPA: thioredoxin family protein [Dehalococcoidia bacterium]|nr:thioredoxin family protein [Dehalococcoidia bacterium]
MIPLADQQAIQAKFAQELAAPVKIDLFTQREVKLEAPGVKPCAFCKQTQQMLQEIAGLSDLISLRIHYFEDNPEQKATFGVERVPAIVLRGPSPGYFKYYGIPGGTEFPAFIESIVDISRWEVLISEDSIKALSELQNEVSVKVFVTPTCPYCPGMARAAFMLGMATEKVHAEVIEVNEFPELADKYKVEAVPLTVINDKIAIPGQMHESALVAQVVKAATQAPAEEGPEKIERGKARDSGLYIP